MPRISRNASNGPRIMPWLRADFAHARASLVLAREAQRAGDHVGMAVEILGRRMHDDIGAERDRPGEHRRRAGGVDAERGARGMGDFCRAGDVADAPQRIARRLQPDEPGRPRPHGGAERRKSSVSQNVTSSPNAGASHGEPIAQRPIHHPRRDDMRAGREARETARSPPTCPSRTTASKPRPRARR